MPGDKVRVEIDGIGFIENEIVQEPDTTKTNSNMEKFDVAICGYGPVGATLSLPAKYNYKVLIIEKIKVRAKTGAINTDGEQLEYLINLILKDSCNSNQIEKFIFQTRFRTNSDNYRKY